jgi:hypothetical protein
MLDPLKVFVSYAREDSELQKSLHSALAALEMTRLIQVWSDREIGPGQDWDKEIDEKIRSADIIVFLLSQDFMNSKYVMGKEYKIAMDRNEKRNATIIPIYLRSVHLGDHPLSLLNLIPRDPSATDKLRPIKQWSDPDAFWTTISRSIAMTANKIRGNGESEEGATVSDEHTEPKSVIKWELRRIAGTGSAGELVNNGPAKDSQLNVPVGIAYVGGDIYVSDRQSLVIRRIDRSGNIHHLVVSSPLCEQLAWTDMCWEKLFVAGGLMRSIFSIDLEKGDVNYIVPEPPNAENQLSSGDGGPALEARFRMVSGIAALRSPEPDLMVSDRLSHNVRCVNTRQGGKVTLFAGNGTRGYSGDHGPAQNAQLNEPTDLTLVSKGLLSESYLYIADTGNHVIRRVRFSDREITTVAGTGEEGFSGDGGPAIHAKLQGPMGIAIRNSQLIISDTGNHRIRMVDASGVITTIAGNGLTGYVGDARDARQTELWLPRGIAVPEYGDAIYVCDAGNHRVISLKPYK